MKKLNLFTTAFIGLSSLAMSAQINQTPVHTGGGQILTKRESSQAATGSMFLNDKYMPAKVSTEENVVLLRYNAYSDFFELNDPHAGKVVTLVKDPEAVISFVGDGQTFAYATYKTEKGNTESGYLNVIANGSKAKVYRKDKIHLQPEVFPENSYQSYKPAVYKKASPEYYISINGGEPTAFEDKKDLAKLAGGKNKEILEFIKKNKIDLEKDQDLVKLGQYLETIL